MLTMNSEKSAVDQERAEVQVQIETEKKKSDEEENKLANSQVENTNQLLNISKTNLLYYS